MIHNKNNFMEGSLVLINKDITSTDNEYGINEIMTKMAGDGKLYKIDQVKKDVFSKRICLRINNFTWDFEDVSFPYHKPDKKSFIFDFTQLDLDESDIKKLRV